MDDERRAADGLPPLRSVIDSYEIAAKKALGQNFLLDLNLTGRVARTAGDLSDKVAFEVGPGPGGLTRALLFEGAKRVVAVERDERCLPALADISAHYDGRLTVIQGDALKTDFSTHLAAGERAAIVANLPYNIGTVLLTNWLESPTWPPYWDSLTLMFQKEVAQRIVAAPGSSHYGRLAVLAQWRCQCSLAFEIPPQAFWPPPKVTSAVVHLIPRDTPIAVDMKKLSTVTRHAFGQRRKMLRQNLKPLGGEELLNIAGIEPTRRAETLTVDEFCALANAL